MDSNRDIANGSEICIDEKIGLHQPKSWKNMNKIDYLTTILCIEYDRLHSSYMYTWQ